MVTSVRVSELAAEGHAVGDWLYANFAYALVGLLLNLLMLPLIVALAWYLTQPRGARTWIDSRLSAETRYGLDMGLCFVGLCLCFVSYGVVQEYIMTHRYAVGGHFPSSIFLVLANRTFALFMLLPLLLVRGERLFWTGCYKCALPALTLMTSSWCQHESLRYVSFPTQIIFKSSKIVPTMAVGTCVLGRSYGWKDYLAAFIITLGVAGFSLAVEEPSVSEAARATMTFGIMLMTIFLICDALTSNGEKRVFTSHPETSPLQMFFVMAIFSWGYSAISVLLTKGFGPIFGFLLANPMAIVHVAILSITASFGQVLIFHIVKAYGPVIFSVMMTIRQMISVVTSALIFGHSLSPTAMICAVAVFTALFINAYKPGAAKQQHPAGSSDPKKSEGRDEAAPLTQGSAGYGALPLERHPLR